MILDNRRNRPADYSGQSLECRRRSLSNREVLSPAGINQHQSGRLFIISLKSVHYLQTNSPLLYVHIGYWLKIHPFIFTNNKFVYLKHNGGSTIYILSLQRQEKYENYVTPVIRSTRNCYLGPQSGMSTTYIANIIYRI